MRCKASRAPGRAGVEIRLRVCNTLGSPRRETVSATLPEGLGDGELAVTNAKGKRFRTPSSRRRAGGGSCSKPPSRHSVTRPTL